MNRCILCTPFLITRSDQTSMLGRVWGERVLDGARIDEGTDSERKFGNLYEVPH